MATSQDVIAFRLGYAEFKALTDADVAGALDDADVWLDPTLWAPRDFPMARYLLAAHNLAVFAQLLAQQEAMGDLMGFTDQTLATVGFGERRIGFRQLRTMKSGKNVSTTGPDEELEETWYGRRYLMLRSRNIIGVMTV